jgi:hypothetical protein
MRRLAGLELTREWLIEKIGAFSTSRDEAKTKLKEFATTPDDDSDNVSSRTLPVLNPLKT